MMSNPAGQDNPEQFSDLMVSPVEAVVKQLESNKGLVTVWFWKGLLAFNLVLWSVALPIAFVVR